MNNFDYPIAMEHYFLILHQHLFNPDRLPVALGALALTVIGGLMTGPWIGNVWPMYWGLLDRVFGAFGSKLDRRHRAMPVLVARGVILTLLVLAFSFYMARGVQGMKIYMPYHGVLETFALSLMFTSGSVWFALSRLHTALKEKRAIKGAFFNISRSTRIDFSASDDYTITRSGMALAARTFDKGLVSPLVWYLIAGLPGAFVYSGLAVLVWRFGKDGFGKGFASLPMALERLMGFVPSLFAGLLIALAGLFTPTGGMTRALAGMFSHKHAAPYEEGGLPVTAMAFALKVSLNGPVVDLEGSALQKNWAGPAEATARLESGHLQRGLYISIIAHLLLAAGIGSAMVYG